MNILLGLDTTEMGPVLVDEKGEGLHYRSLDTIFLDDVYSFNTVKGTGLAATQYEEFKFTLQVYEKCKKKAKYRCPDRSFDPPIIFWSNLTIYKKSPSRFLKDMAEKFPLIKISHDDTDPITVTKIAASEDYLICTRILSHNNGFYLGFFFKPERYIIDETNKSNISLEELKKARDSYRREYVFNLLQFRADRQDTKVDWGYLMNMVYTKFLVPVDTLISCKEKEDEEKTE